MKQITAKTKMDVLVWISGNSHHDADATSGTHLILKGYHAKIRIPLKIWMESQALHCVNKREFDTRMFAPTKAGRAYMRREIAKQTGQISS